MQADATETTVEPLGAFASAVGRWAGVGPYYAMFPVSFAVETVARLTEPGEGVLDPFAGRGSSLYAASTSGRPAAGVEINPVGWLYGKTKLGVASLNSVLSRLGEIAALPAPSDACFAELPSFFSACFAPEVLSFLLRARISLEWRTRASDRTLMALILVYLHGKREASLSNQMRQSKAMSPQYSQRWWSERDMHPPDIDPVSFLRQRIEWRYRKGRPSVTDSQLIRGDSTSALHWIEKSIAKGRFEPFSLLFTSPPYIGVTNYHYDQWLRLWMLGGAPNALRSGRQHTGKFDGEASYRTLITSVFEQSATLLAADARVLVRVDAREPTLSVVRDALCAAFPRHQLTMRNSPYTRPTQTALFGDRSAKPGEVDIELAPTPRR